MIGSIEVCRETGLTYRRLDHWCRSGLIEPVVGGEGSGSKRLFHPNVIGHIGRLLAAIEACPFDHHRR